DRLFLNTRVQSIRWKRRAVEIQTEARLTEGSRLFRAKHVIVTVPLGVLQARDIRFEPDLFAEGSAKRNALDLLRSGAVSKVILEFKERFWENQDRVPPLGFVHGRELDFGTWWGALPLHLPILTGWAGGPSAEKLSRL